MLKFPEFVTASDILDPMTDENKSHLQAQAENVHCRYIIEGYTEDGRKFRPSDWIDRIASLMASYGTSHRLVFSELMHPELYQGQKCLIINTELEVKNPQMFDYVMHFVRSNNLKMRQVCEKIDSQLGS